MQRVICQRPLLLVGRSLLEPPRRLVGSRVSRDVAVAADGRLRFASSTPTVLGFGPEGFVTAFAREPISGRLRERGSITPMGKTTSTGWPDRGRRS